jgi:hypothetical protein
MAFSFTAVQLALAHGAVDLLMQSMTFRLASVSVIGLTALSTCSRTQWHSDSLPCSLLWLMALLTRSHSPWHSNLHRVLDLAHGPVKLQVHFRAAGVRSRRCRHAHAVDGIRAYFRAACCCSRCCRRALQSMAPRIAFVTLTWLTTLSTHSCSRWRLNLHL